MPLWLMQRRHRLKSFPLGITRGILCHKILVWNAFGRFMAMTLENAGLEKQFQTFFSIQATWLLWGISSFWYKYRLHKLQGTWSKYLDVQK